MSNPFLKDLFPINWQYKKTDRQNTMTKVDLAQSLDVFTKEVLKESPENKVTFQEVEIVRLGEEKIKVENFEVWQEKMRAVLGTHYCDLLFHNKIKNNVKIVVVSDYFQDSFITEAETCFSKDSASMVEKMLGAIHLQSSNYLITALHRKEDDFNNLENIKKMFFFYEPNFIICFGAIASKALLNNTDRLSQLNGKIEKRNWFFNGQEQEVNIMPLFHPDYLLINPVMKKNVWEGLLQIQNLLK